jgi:hypothetical protein
MAVFLFWLESVLLCYIASAAFNTGLNIPGIPWWLWGVILALVFVANKITVSRKRLSLFSFIILNGVYLFLFCALPVLAYQGSGIGVTVKYFVPTLCEVILGWAFFSYVVFRPFEPKQRVLFLEIGLVLSLLCLGVLQKTNQATFALLLAPAGFVLAGLLIEAITNSRGTANAKDKKVKLGIPLLTSLGLMAVGLAAGFLAITSAFRGLVTSVKNFIFYLFMLLNNLLATLGLDKHAVAKKYKTIDPAKDIEQLTPVTAASAPRWFMIMLWTIMVALVVILVAIIIYRLVRLVKELRAQVISLSGKRGPQVTSSIDWGAITRVCRSLPGYLWSKIKPRINWMLAINPTNTLELYAYFLFWGKKARLGRSPNETTNEYLKRINPALADQYPELLPPLETLTASYDRERYGGEQDSLPAAMISRIFRQLRRVKRNLS